MALANPLGVAAEMVATTLRNRTGKLADNVTKNNALLNQLQKKGNVMPVSGGRTIMQEIEYAENGTYRRYSGYETLDISPSDVFTYAEYNYAQAAVAISMSGLESIQNDGDEAIIDLMASRIKNAQKTMENNISLDCYSDGTADGGRQIGGLQLLVATTPTNTVGGIDASTTIGAFWRNSVFSAATNGGAAVSSANIVPYMNRVFNNQIRGTDMPDLIITDNNYFAAYENALQAIQRIASDSTGSMGFRSLKYLGNIDVVLDGGVGGGCPTNTMYFLNTDYIYFRPHVARDFAPLDERLAINQDAMVKFIAFAGNMTVSNRRLQAVLTA